MTFTIIEDPTKELTRMVSEGVDRHHISVSAEAQAYVAGVISSLMFADDLFTARQNSASESDAGRSITPFTFQLRDAADKPYLFKEVGDRCLFVLGFCYDSVRRGGALQVRYHYDVGRSAYSRYAHVLAKYQDHSLSSTQADPLFTELADSFEGLATVVGDLHLKRLDDERALLDVYERYLRTGDHRYVRLLQAKGIAVDVNGGSS